MAKLIFFGYNITPKFLRTDKSWRVEIDVSQDQVRNIGQILMGLPEGLYQIEIKPVVNDPNKEN